MRQKSPPARTNPTTSIVLVLHAGDRGWLAPWTNLLRGLTARGDVQVVAVRPEGSEAPEGFPIVDVPMPPGATEVEYRQTGLRAATGDVVSLIVPETVPWTGQEGQPNRGDGVGPVEESDWRSWLHARAVLPPEDPMPREHRL